MEFCPRSALPGALCEIHQGWWSPEGPRKMGRLPKGWGLLSLRIHCKQIQNKDDMIEIMDLASVRIDIKFQPMIFVWIIELASFAIMFKGSAFTLEGDGSLCLQTLPHVGARSRRGLQLSFMPVEAIKKGGFTSAWWWLEHELYVSLQLGMSSSQSTNSYFSEGLKAQPPTRYIAYKHL